MLGEALDEFRCLLWKSRSNCTWFGVVWLNLTQTFWQTTHTYRELSERRPWKASGAISEIWLLLRSLGKHRVIREKKLQRMRKKQRKSNWLGHLTIALTLCTHSLAPLKHLYSIWSDFCWQARGIFGAPSLHSFTWLPTESCAWVGWGCICPRHGFWLAQPVCPMLEWWGEILQRRRAFPSYWNAVEQAPQVHGPLSKPQWAFFALWAF